MKRRGKGVNRGERKSSSKTTGGREMRALKLTLSKKLLHQCRYPRVSGMERLLIRRAPKNTLRSEEEQVAMRISQEEGGKGKESEGVCEENSTSVNSLKRACYQKGREQGGCTSFLEKKNKAKKGAFL